MKKYMLILGLAVVLFSCGKEDKKEITRLQSKVDSLNDVIVQKQKTEATLDEVGIMIDSIDVSRNALSTKMVEGSLNTDYVNRLRDINLSIKDTQKKLVALERDLKKSRTTSLATINKLKKDLNMRSKEIVELQMDVTRLANTVIERDVTIADNNEEINQREAEVASLIKQAEETNNQNRVMVADLYFAEAQALEEQANRTQFAPRKKKEAREEALELYKLSYSMGNLTAESKIKELTKKLS